MKQGQIDFLDIISLMSFCIALQNLDLNISQEDIQMSSQEIERAVNERIEKALDDIHGHLSVQDAKLNILMERLDSIDGNTRNIPKDF